MRKILFICSGNYYRSRFAEAVFNHLAMENGLPWRAFSRGLAIYLVEGCGPISQYTLAEMRYLGIPLSRTGTSPVALGEEDLVSADRVVALKRIEHQPMMRDQFPEWMDRIDYWQVHDLDGALPHVALEEIHQKVTALVEELSADPPPLQP